MTIKDLTYQYQVITQFVNTHWPLKSKQQRIFARTMKIVEELGELSDAILASMNLQRTSKLQAFTRQDIEDEFADVFASLVMLSIELDIDITEVMKRKIEFTKERFEIE